MPPRVSVVVPNYNHAPYLERRLRSVLDQTVRDIEVIFLDDASPDDSLAVFERVVAGDPRVRLVRNEANSGSTFKQWNKGVALASAEYVWLAESDDAADPRFLEVLLGRLERNPNVGLAYCRSVEIDAAGTPTGQLLPRGPRWDADYVNAGRAEVLDYLSGSNTIPNASGVVFRRALYHEAGGADGRYKLVGDWMFYIQLCLRADIAYVAEPLNYFRTHADTVRHSPSKRLAVVEETIRVWEYVLRNLAPTRAARSRVRLGMYCCYFHGDKLGDLPPSAKRRLWGLALRIDPYLPLRPLQYYYRRARGLPV